MDTLGARLAFARKKRGINQLELAEACGWDSQGRISNYENNRREPSLSELKRMASELKVNYSWLATGAGDPDLRQGNGDKTDKSGVLVTYPAKSVLGWDADNPLPEGEFVMIPRLDVQLSAGNGTVIYDVDEKQPHAFRADWLIKRKLRAENICLMYACGDSMEDFIQDGDTLLVDVSNRVVVDNQVYALRYGDELRVKRLFKRPDGGLRIVSDNKQYPEETVSPEEVEAYIDIIGKIVWRGG